MIKIHDHSSSAKIRNDLLSRYETKIPNFILPKPRNCTEDDEIKVKMEEYSLINMATERHVDVKVSV